MKKKLVSILIALAMMVVLAVPAFAATPSYSSTPGTDAKVGISKTLTIPKGTTIPTDTYGFTISQVTDNTSYESTAATYTANVTAKGVTGAGTEASATEYVINYDDILSGAKFTKAGKYAFDIVETAPTATGTGESWNATTHVFTKETTNQTTGVKTTETTEYSQAKYRLVVGVATYDDNGTVGYYIDTIQAITITDDDGKDADEGTKPDGSLTPENGNKSAVNFTNDYLKKVTNEKPKNKDDDNTKDDVDGSTLFISKTVTKAGGVDKKDFTDTNKQFQFTATVTFPEGVTSYKYKIVKANSDETYDEVTISDTNTDKTETFTFALKNGERLVFTDIAVGATYTVSEYSYTGYAPAYVSGNVSSGSANTAAVTIKDNTSNKTAVTNTYDSDEDPATGLSINNLPYIVLALVAVGGLVAYVVARRKADNEA